MRRCIRADDLIGDAISLLLECVAGLADAQLRLHDATEHLVADIMPELSEWMNARARV